MGAALVLLLGALQEGPDPADLLRKLEDDHLEVREAAEESLGTADPALLPRLRLALPGLKGEAKARLAETIRRLELRARLAQLLPRPSTVVLPDAVLPFSSAFESLRKQIRIPVALGEDLDGTDRSIRVVAGRTSAWDALDRLLSAHGAAALDLGEEGLRIVRGARRLGVHRGPHAAWLQGLEADEERSFLEPAAQSQCSIDLAVSWEPGGGGPIRVRARLLEAVDSKGRLLLDPEGELAWASEFTAGERVPGRILTLQLDEAPDMDAATIARLRSQVEFHYPLDRVEFRIDVGSGPRRTAISGPWTLSLVGLRNEDGKWNAQCRLGGTPEEGQEVLVESVKLADKDGHLHEGVFPFEISPDEEGILQFSGAFPGMSPKAEPRRLEVKLVTRTHAEVLDLDLKDVPLSGP